LPSLACFRLHTGAFRGISTSTTFEEIGRQKQLSGDPMKFGNYEIRTDSRNWILQVWIETRDNRGKPSGRRRCENYYYSTLRDMASRVTDLEAKKLVEEVGMEIEDLAKALGEKLAGLEDEIRAECDRVKAHPAA